VDHSTGSILLACCLSDLSALSQLGAEEMVSAEGLKGSRSRCEAG